MGYDFSIGEAVLYAPTVEEIDTGDDCPEIRVRVTPLRDESGSTQTSRSSGSFYEFTCRVGIEDLFFDPERPDHRLGDGLMPEHPGCARLTPRHLARFREALAVAEKIDDADADAEIDRTTARWFVRWTERALAECKVPALYNH